MCVGASSGRLPASATADHAVRVAFLDFLVDLLHDYREFVAFDAHDDVVFDAAAFLERRDDESRPLLSRLIQTQTFLNFLNQHVVEPALLYDLAAYARDAPPHTASERPHQHAQKRRDEAFDFGALKRWKARTPGKGLAGADLCWECIKDVDLCVSIVSAETETTTTTTDARMMSRLELKNELESRRHQGVRLVDATESLLHNRPVQFGELCCVIELLQMESWRERVVAAVVAVVHKVRRSANAESNATARAKSNARAKSKPGVAVAQLQTRQLRLDENAFEGLVFVADALLQYSYEQRDFVNAKAVLDFSSLIERRQDKARRRYFTASPALQSTLQDAARAEPGRAAAAAAAAAAASAAGLRVVGPARFDGGGPGPLNASESESDADLASPLSGGQETLSNALAHARVWSLQRFWAYVLSVRLLSGDGASAVGSPPDSALRTTSLPDVRTESSSGRAVAWPEEPAARSAWPDRVFSELCSVLGTLQRFHLPQKTATAITLQLAQQQGVERRQQQHRDLETLIANVYRASATMEVDADALDTASPALHRRHRSATNSRQLSPLSIASQQMFADSSGVHLQQQLQQHQQGFQVIREESSRGSAAAAAAGSTPPPLARYRVSREHRRLLLDAQRKAASDGTHSTKHRGRGARASPHRQHRLRRADSC